MLESNNKDARTQYCSLSSLVVTDFELIELIGNRFLMCLRVMYFSDGKWVSETVAIHLTKVLGYSLHIRDWEIKSTQPAFTCLKLTIKTLEQGVKYVQS